MKRTASEAASNNEDNMQVMKINTRILVEVQRSGGGDSVTTTTESRPKRVNLTDTKISINVRLDENTFQQHLQSEGQDEERQQAKTIAWYKCLRWLDKSADEAVRNRDSVDQVKKVCAQRLGDEVATTSVRTESLLITVDIPRLVCLYRLRGSCESKSLPDDLEPVLITSEMREEADTAGIPLQLIATYDQVRFDELELFFLNRDGGGIEPVNIRDDSYDDENVEEILEQIRRSCLTLSDDETEEKSDPEETDVKPSEEITQHAEAILPSTSDSVSLQSKSLLPYEASPSQMKQMLQSEMTDLKKQLDAVLKEKSKIQMEKKILESQLKEVLEETSQIEKQYNDCKRKLANAEKVAAKQLKDIQSLKQKLKNKDHRSIRELQAKLQEKEKEIIELKKKLSELSSRLPGAEQRLKSAKTVKPGAAAATLETRDVQQKKDVGRTKKLTPTHTAVKTTQPNPEEGRTDETGSEKTAPPTTKNAGDN